MSLGLLNELAELIGDPTRVGSIDFNSDLQTEVIEACLAPRTKMGKRKGDDPVDLDTLEMSIGDIENLLDWVKEHIMDFFLRRFQATSRVLDRHQGTMKALEQFLNGSKSGASETSSSGASA
jgi:hypothetical protein